MARGRLISLQFQESWKWFCWCHGKKSPTWEWMLSGEENSAQRLYVVRGWLTSRLPASHRCEIIAVVYLARGKGEGKGFFARVPASSAHTHTSWDCSFGLNVNPAVCEFVCFGQIMTSCFLEDRAKLPKASLPGSSSYQRHECLWGKQNGDTGRRPAHWAAPRNAIGVWETGRTFQLPQAPKFWSKPKNSF